MTKRLRSAALLLVLASIAGPVLADPPPWSPAHGWRKKNDPDYVGYTGKKWDKDYGVLNGNCDSAAVGAVLGGAVGGAIGSQVAKEGNRPVAILVGTVIGAVIGSKIGAQVNNGDRGCMGHALELAGEQQTVAWTNAATGVTYKLTPTRNFGDVKNPCREFKAVAVSGRLEEKHPGKGKGKGKGQNKSGGEAAVDGVACRAPGGEWQLKI